MKRRNINVRGNQFSYAGVLLTSAAIAAMVLMGCGGGPGGGPDDGGYTPPSHEHVDKNGDEFCDDDNIFITNGKEELYNNDGFDVDGIHKTTKKPWDLAGDDKNRVSQLGTVAYRQWYNENGNGQKLGAKEPEGGVGTQFPTYTPTDTILTFSNEYVIGQSSATNRITSLRSMLDIRAGELLTEFQGSTQGVANCPNVQLRDAAIAAFTEIDKFVANGNSYASNDGYVLTKTAVDGISNYIACITQQLPAEQQAGFTKLMNAYRYNAYMTSRTSFTKQNLQTEYSSSMMGLPNGVDETTIRDYMLNTVASDLSVKLDVSPFAMQSLFNNIYSVEWLYGSVDDIWDKSGYTDINTNTQVYMYPTADGSIQTTRAIPQRTQAVVNQMVTDHMSAHVECEPSK